MHIVRGTRGIRARALAVVRQQIDPALGERAIDRPDVVGAERRDGRGDMRLRLFRRVRSSTESTSGAYRS